jgi:hypothetical protein
MDILKIPLIILFKNQNPYRILQKYFYDYTSKQSYHEKIDKKIFVNLCQEEENQFSKDDAENIYYIVKESMTELKKDMPSNESVFNLLINYSGKILENCGDAVRCKYKDLLKWREISLKLDQDLFICSFFALEDIFMRKERKYFDWDVIIKSNNIRLHNLLSQGMSENHFHLKGSAPTFKLSWVSLMNDIDCSKKVNLKYNNRLDKDDDGYIDIEESIVIAAAIRVVLFKLLMDEQMSQKDTLEDILKEVIFSYDNYEIRIDRSILSMYYNDIKCEISSLKYLFGTDLRHNSRNVKVDYAITENVSIEDRSARLFSGERYFMYSCFRKIYENDKKFMNKADLFYAYLILKNKVRAELVQENRRVGFSNFSDYQNRKSKYMKKYKLLSDSMESLAVLTSVQNQNIVSLEARVIPENTSYKNIKYIHENDSRICNEIYNDKRNYWIRSYDKELKKEILNEDLSVAEKNIIFGEREIEKYNYIIDNIKNKYFYVYHFCKKKDDSIDKDNIYNLVRCRHYKYRRELKNVCFALKKIREENQKDADRILGIDACSNELVARPEVYGQAFRFLKGHLPSHDYRREILQEKSLQKLRATYHVGEDFLDVIDGLRAIDEAIEFLQLTHGDRLGHAIVLGIDVKKWYENKFNRVYLTKQNLLDNIAWLINKIKQFDVDAGSDTIDKLIRIFNKYYVEIYIDENYNEGQFSSASSVVPVDTYISAWELRGDNPEVYLKRKNRTDFTYWDRCGVRKENNNSLIKQLYLRYHYDPQVKIKGSKIEPFKIESYIIDIVIKIQKHMQIYVRERGIGIEANPSSNVLISTFKRYDKHPIFNMYNRGLDYGNKFENSIPQMFVSINTDDQGLFDTLLENEYALMAIALEKVKDENGNARYSQAEVYDWIDRVRRMGIEQSFRTV